MRLRADQEALLDLLRLMRRPDERIVRVCTTREDADRIYAEAKRLVKEWKP